MVAQKSSVVNLHLRKIFCRENSKNHRQTVFFMIYYEKAGACNSAGRVLEWHSRSRVFDPRQVHQAEKTPPKIAASFSIAAGAETNTVRGLTYASMTGRFLPHHIFFLYKIRVKQCTKNDSQRNKCCPNGSSGTKIT